MAPHDPNHGQNHSPQERARGSFLDPVIGFCLDNKLVVVLVTILIIGWGLMVAPFDWELGGLPRTPGLRQSEPKPR